MYTASLFSILRLSFSLQYQEVVAKARFNYEQALEQYKTAKAKYEEHFLKCEYWAWLSKQRSIPKCEYR